MPFISRIAIPIYTLTESTSKHFAGLIIVTKPNLSTLVILLTITRRKKLKITKLNLPYRNNNKKGNSNHTIGLGSML